jgi:hypothetical protein
MEELTRGMVFLAPPDRDGLREALVAPVEMVGYRFESADMVEDILAALAETSGALPLLQFAAGKLWDARSRDRRLITMDSYRAIGGITGALATHADDVIASMSSSQRTLTRSILRQLVTPERTRAIAEVSDLHQLSADAGETMRIVDQLVGARLLVVQTRDAGSSVELVHESLIMSWPTLKRWLDDDAEDAQFRNQLTTAAKQWEAKGRAPGLLWRGEAMTEARRWFDAQPREMAPRDRAFLDAVFAAARRGKRVRTAIIITAFGLLSAIAIVSVVAMFKINQERRAAQDAQAETQAALDDAREKDRQARIATAMRDEAKGEKDQALRDKLAAEAERLKANKLVDEKEMTIEQKKAELEKQNAELKRSMSEVMTQKQAAERAMSDAKKLADKLEAARRELEAKLSAERKLREDAERRAKGLSKELK